MHPSRPIPPQKTSIHCVCKYVYIYIYYIILYIYIYVCVCVWRHISLPAFIYCMYIYIYLFICCMCILRICIYIYICIYIPIMFWMFAMHYKVPWRSLETIFGKGSDFEWFLTQHGPYHSPKLAHKSSPTQTSSVGLVFFAKGSDFWRFSSLKSFPETSWNLIRCMFFPCSSSHSIIPVLVMAAARWGFGSFALRFATQRCFPVTGKMQDLTLPSMAVSYSWFLI